MKDKPQAEAEVKTPDEMFVSIKFNIKTGAFAMRHDAPSPVIAMGILSFGIAQLGKPKEPAIQVAHAIPAGMKTA